MLSAPSGDGCAVGEGDADGGATDAATDGAAEEGAADAEPPLDHVADQFLLEVDARAVVSIGHGALSSCPAVGARTSASLGGHAISTSLPTACRSPVFGASTVIDRPPCVRTWYWTLPPI